MTERAAPSRRLRVLNAAASGAIIAVPVALVNVVLAAQDPKPTLALNLTLLGLLAGFVLAGAVAGATVDEERAKAGALAACITYVPVEVIGLLGRADQGRPISAFQIVFVGFLAALGGTAGARLGAARRARKDMS